MECLEAKVAAPGTLGGLFDGGLQAVHVVAAIAIVAEEELVVVFRGPADGAALAFDTLPRVLLHRHHHVVRELEARGVTCHESKLDFINNREQLRQIYWCKVLTRSAAL